MARKKARLLDDLIPLAASGEGAINNNMVWCWNWKVLNDRLVLEWCTDVLRITQGGKYICLGILTFSKRNDRAGTSSATYG